MLGPDEVAAGDAGGLPNGEAEAGAAAATPKRAPAGAAEAGDADEGDPKPAALKPCAGARVNAAPAANGAWKELCVAEPNPKDICDRRDRRVDAK